MIPQAKIHTDRLLQLEGGAVLPVGTDLGELTFPNVGEEVIQFRFSTPALVGAWRDSHLRAMQDALEAGRATLVSNGPQRIILREFATIEQREEPLELQRSQRQVG